jgi:hypothetical protein
VIRLQAAAWRWRIPLTALSVAAFAVALTQPAFFFGNSAASSGPAWRVLLQGWRAVPHGYVEWCANPALFLSWATVLRRPGISLALAGSAGVLMLIFLFRDTFFLPGAAAATVIVSHGGGYWFWVGSALLMVVAHARAVPR